MFYMTVENQKENSDIFIFHPFWHQLWVCSIWSMGVDKMEIRILVLISIS